MQYSVCLPAVLRDVEINEALKTVKETGFNRYEIWGWWDLDLDAYLKAQQEYGLQITTMCAHGIPLNDAACHEEYVNKLRETAETCKKLGCSKIIAQTGQERMDISREEQHRLVVEGLKACVPVLEEYDLTLMLEPLNTKIDHQGYYLWSSEEAFQMIEEVGNPHVTVLYDLYHQYIMDDLELEKIAANIDKISHFHLAGYPGRNEPMYKSEIEFVEILKTIKKSGYKHCIGLEYFPVQDVKEGLKQLREILAEI